MSIWAMAAGVLTCPVGALAGYAVVVAREIEADFWRTRAVGRGLRATRRPMTMRDAASSPGSSSMALVSR